MPYLLESAVSGERLDLLLDPARILDGNLLALKIALSSGLVVLDGDLTEGHRGSLVLEDARLAVIVTSLSADLVGDVPDRIRRTSEVAGDGGDAAVLAVILAETREGQVIGRLVSASEVEELDEVGLTSHLELLSLLADDVGDFERDATLEVGLLGLGHVEELLTDRLEVVGTAHGRAVVGVTLDLEGRRDADVATLDRVTVLTANAARDLDVLESSTLGRLAGELPGVDPSSFLDGGGGGVTALSGEGATDNRDRGESHELLHFV